MIEIIKGIIEMLINALGRQRALGNPTRVADLDHIKKWEQLRLKAYLPTPHDVWTIGWGHTATAYEGMVITEKEAEKLLRKDLAWVRKTIADLVEVPLSQKQYDALAGLIFNIGRPNFSTSTVLRRLNAYDYEGAADAFLMWNKQRQNGHLVVLRGLKRRREEERAMFLEGTET
jgi:lysozyme